MQKHGKQVEIELDKAGIDHGKKKGKIGQQDAKLLVKHMESLEAAPPTHPIDVVIWEENSMFPPDCFSFAFCELSPMDLCTVH